MSQISSTIKAQAVPQVSGAGKRRLAISVAAIVFMTIAVVIARTTAPASTVDLRAGEVVDGWMSGLAAERAIVAANSTTDGYLPGLMAAWTSGGDSVDGWMAGLIAPYQIAPLLVVDVTDGWEAGLR